MRYRRRHNPYSQIILYIILLIIVVAAFISVKQTKPSAEESYASDAALEDQTSNTGDDRFYAPDPDKPLVDEDGTPLPTVIETGAREEFIIWPESSTLTNELFGVKTLKSTVDFDHDGKDDYADILEGAHAEAALRPVYDRHFYDEGHPPVGYGNTVDFIIRAFKNAGYSLRQMFDNDIDANPEAYDFTYREPEVDFRIVRLMNTYFKRKAVSLSTDIDERGEWMPGDIVVLGENDLMGIVSERRNAYGRAYILLNDGSGEYEIVLSEDSDVTAHYRFDASLLSSVDLVAWSDETDTAASEPIIDEEDEPDDEGSGEYEEPGEEIYDDSEGEAYEDEGSE